MTWEGPLRMDTLWSIVEFNFQMWTFCVNVMESWEDWWVILYAVPVVLMVGRLSDLGVEIADFSGNVNRIVSHQDLGAGE